MGVTAIPYDSNGNFSLSAGYLAVTGQTILASQHNPPLEDIANALSEVLLRSGAAPMGGNFNFNSFKGINLALGTENGNAIEYSQLQTVITSVSTLDTTLRALITASSIPTGQRGSFFRQTAPTGWIIGNGGTIGNASSGASTRANADTENLFTLFWNSFTNATLPVFNSDGSTSSRGASAAVDYAANKRLRIFDLRTRYDRGADEGLGFDTGLLVGVNHGDTDGPHAHTVARNSSDGAPGTDQAHSVTGGVGLTLATSSTSGSIGTETAPRTVVSLPCIKL